MQKTGLFGMNGFMVLLLTCMSVTAYAQQPGYLILLETENKQPFTVRVGDQTYASSGQGHLVIPHLKDSVYRLNIRFPKKNIDELVFPVVVRQKDLGFQLKGGDAVWVLYNWQTRETIQPLKERDSNRILDQGVKREDGFSRLMASVVNDSSVMYNTYSGTGFSQDSASKAQIPKPKAESVPVQALPTANGQPPTANVLPSPSPVIPAQKHLNDSLAAAAKAARKDSLLAVKKSSDSLMAAGKASRKDSIAAAKKTRDSLIAAGKAARKDSLLAIKRSKDSLSAAAKPAINKDTVQIQPSTVNRQPSTINRQPSTDLPSSVIRQPSTDLPSTVNRQPSTTLSRVKKLREVSLKISRKLVFLDISRDGTIDTVTLFVYFETPNALPSTVNRQPSSEIPSTVNRQPSTPGGKPPTANAPQSIDSIQKKLAEKASESGCGQLATNADMEFLRSAILKANTEEDKISLAGSAFSQKCFSVSQVRILAGLFVSDKARYRLMEAARLHIADPDHFHELADMYADKNFKRKFLTMAEKRS